MIRHVRTLPARHIAAAIIAVLGLTALPPPGAPAAAQSRLR